MSQVGKWLDANPAERALLERLSEVTAAAPVAGIDVEAALARVHGRMGERTPAALSPASARARRRWQPLAFASLLAAAAVVAFLVRRQAASPAGSVTTVASQTFSTTGQARFDHASDGRAWSWQPDSRLTVPADFGSEPRAVELHGDAYFDVRHDGQTVRGPCRLGPDPGRRHDVHGRERRRQRTV